MNNAETGTRLWPLAAALGDATLASGGTLAVLQGVVQQLGELCAARAELWEATTGATGSGPRWRLRSSFDTPPLALRGPAEYQPDAQIVRAATTLRTVSDNESTTTLAFPILAFGRLLGVLRLSAIGADAALSGWRRDLERFVPVLALYLHATELNEALASGILRDRLTGIANQAQLHEHLERELARARRTRRPFAIMLVAPDRFDALGGELGLPLRDRVMQTLATMLRNACRHGDIIGRLGADRFLILLPDSTGQGAQLAAQRYLSHFYRRPIMLPEGAPLYLDLSIGIALFPVDGAAIGELVDSSAAALREAQRLGGKRAVAA